METTIENYKWTQCREPSPTGHMYLTVPASVAQGASPKWGWTCCEHQNTGKLVVKVSPRNGHIDKMGTMAMSIDTQTWKEESLGAPSWTNN